MHVCVQDSIRYKEDRIEELEEALRESVQITTERELVLAHEEQARTHAEKQVLSISVSHLPKKKFTFPSTAQPLRISFCIFSPPTDKKCFLADILKHRRAKCG